MNKEQLLSNIQESTGAQRGLIDGILKSFMESVIEATRNGEEIRLIGFGTFKVSSRKETTGRNPRTGKAIQIPASTRPKFVPSKVFIDAVNNSNTKSNTKESKSSSKSKNTKNNDTSSKGNNTISSNKSSSKATNKK